MPTAFVLAPPKAGDPGFGFECWQAPPSQPGVLLFSPDGAISPLALLGVDLWLDLKSWIIPLAAMSGPEGRSRIPLALPPGTVGLSLGAQFLWPEKVLCGINLGYCASEALVVTVQ